MTLTPEFPRRQRPPPHVHLLADPMTRTGPTPSPAHGLVVSPPTGDDGGRGSCGRDGRCPARVEPLLAAVSSESHGADAGEGVGGEVAGAAVVAGLGVAGGLEAVAA